MLVTTLTKRMAEDLTDYLLETGFKVRYLHSEIDTLERIQIVRDLRLGEFDVLVGINLLREGLDLPEVTLVAILDADKEGFLRGQTASSRRSGAPRATSTARSSCTPTSMTAAMRVAIGETDRRRAPQIAYNEEHGIEPRSIVKGVTDIAQMLSDAAAVPTKGRRAAKAVAKKMAMPRAELEKLIDQPRGGDVRGRRPAQVRVRRQAARRDQGAQQGARAERRGSWLTPCTCSGSSPRREGLGAARAAPLPAARRRRRRARQSQVPRAAVLGLRRTTSCARRHVMPGRTRRAAVLAQATATRWSCSSTSRSRRTASTSSSQARTLRGVQVGRRGQIDGAASEHARTRFAHLMTDARARRLQARLPVRGGVLRRRVRALRRVRRPGRSAEQCRHPFEARPSMEAVGIDVVATAEAAGLSVELPAEDHPAWTGLLLID